MYVALTRSKGRVYLLHPTDEPSPFVEELIDREQEKVELLGRVSDRLLCPRCQGRSILRRVGEFGSFWSCLHYPLCDGRLHTCENCDDGALVSEDARTLVCSACETSAERCPQCREGRLILRTNRKAGTDFWGCSAWLPDGQGCHFTRDA